MTVAYLPYAHEKHALEIPEFQFTVPDQVWAGSLLRCGGDHLKRLSKLVFF